MITISHVTTIFIIIHGTWAAKETWHMPEGDFFKQVEQQCTNNKFVVPFHWTGSLSSAARYSAAQALVKTIESYPPKTTKFVVISHSHGGNVGVLASQILGQRKKCLHHIHVLINLATPVDAEYYMPDMNVVHYVLNMFSFSDRIQSVFGFFDYEYPSHERIANIRVSLNGQAPTHSDFHDPLIGKWLPHLADFLLSENLEYPFLNKLNFKQDGIIHFIQKYSPIFAHDTEREKFRNIQKKRRLNQLILSITRQNKNTTKTQYNKKILTIIKNNYQYDHPDLLHSDQEAR